MDALASVLSGQSTVVRVSASWALANVSDVLLRGVQGGSSSQDGGEMAIINLELLTHIGNAAMRACYDCDKVQANAVRALGHALSLLAFVEGGAGEFKIPLPEWVFLIGILFSNACCGVLLNKITQTMVSS